MALNNQEPREQSKVSEEKKPQEAPSVALVSVDESAEQLMLLLEHLEALVKCLEELSSTIKEYHKNAKAKYEVDELHIRPIFVKAIRIAEDNPKLRSLLQNNIGKFKEFYQDRTLEGLRIRIINGERLAEQKDDSPKILHFCGDLLEILWDSGQLLKVKNEVKRLWEAAAKNNAATIVPVKHYSPDDGKKMGFGKK